MLPVYANAVKAFEGFTSKATFDFAQYSNGYGTKAAYPGEVIDRTEAERRFQSEINDAYRIVQTHAPELDEGTKAALTSLTYNAGTAWIQDGLGDAVRRGDLDEMRSLFVQYNKAGGEVLPGLTKRRLEEVLWIGMSAEGATGSPGADSPLANTSQSDWGITPPLSAELGTVATYRSATAEGFLYSNSPEWGTPAVGGTQDHVSFEELRRKLVGLLFGLFRA